MASRTSGRRDGLHADDAVTIAEGPCGDGRGPACGSCCCGDRAQGAPNLTGASWLYGGDVATLTETVTNARFGVMPSWSFAPEGGEQRLSEAEIRAVAAYVHGLGGGE